MRASLALLLALLAPAAQAAPGAESPRALMAALAAQADKGDAAALAALIHGGEQAEAAPVMAAFLIALARYEALRKQVVAKHGDLAGEALARAGGMLTFARPPFADLAKHGKLQEDGKRLLAKLPDGEASMNVAQRDGRWFLDGTTAKPRDLQLIKALLPEAAAHTTRCKEALAKAADAHSYSAAVDRSGVAFQQAFQALVAKLAEKK